MPANDPALRRRIEDNFLKLDPDSNGLVPDQQKLAPVREKIRQDFATVRARSWVSLWEDFGQRGKAESDQRPRAEGFSAEFEAVLIWSEDIGFTAAIFERTPFSAMLPLRPKIVSRSSMRTRVPPMIPGISCVR
jgi:hypothetical protein